MQKENSWNVFTDEYLRREIVYQRKTSLQPLKNRGSILK